MKVTISDVAELAGVAKSTVSRYLNGGYVSDETRKKINKVIKDTNYEPNTFAQSLKAKKTNLIGVIIPRLNSYTGALLLKGIDETLRGANYQMLISNTDQKIEREIESLYNFVNQKVAGIVLITANLTEEHERAINEISIPVLVVGQDHEKLPSLSYADKEAGYAVGNYVTSRGHRQFIYLGVTEEDVAVGIKRKQGFLEAIEKVKDCEVSYYESSFLMEGAKKLFSEIIKKEDNQAKTLVVCATDNIALGVMKAVRQQGLQVPQDISITGFGDYEIADLMELTTIQYPYQEVGNLTAKKIVSLSEGKEIETVINKQFTLIERGSVAVI